MESPHAQRKNEHLSLAEKLYQTSHQTNPFDDVQLVHNPLPEINLADVSTTVNLGPLTLDQPFYIEAMTGGSEQALRINQQLAQVAANHHLAMATGSASIVMKDPTTAKSFQVVRTVDPDGLVFANLSASATLQQAQKAISLLDADALELHVNAAQELTMADGDRNFHWLINISQLTRALNVPVIVKEVGFGISKEAIRALTEMGVNMINVSGRGGTNFAAIEDRRNRQNDFPELNSWGQTTPEALLEARQGRSPSTTIISSGGICSPLDVIKSGVMGAQAVGVAGYFLHILQNAGVDALDKEVSRWEIALPRLLALLGCATFADLSKKSFVLHGATYEYAQQRGLM